MGDALRVAMLPVGLLLALAQSAIAQSVQLTGNVIPVIAAGQPKQQTLTLTALVDDVVIQNLSLSSAGGNNEYYITDMGTCTSGAYVTAGTSCTFTVTFNPLAAGYGQAPAPIGRWAKVTLQYTDEVYGGPIFVNYPITGSANAPNQVVSPGIMSDIVGNDATPLVGFAGDGGPASGAIFAQPSSIAMDAYGNLYITESGNSVVRMVYEGGTFQFLNNPAVGDIYTIAGVAPSAGVSQAGPGVDGVLAKQSPLNNPTGVSLDPLGNIYIADSGNNAIRMVSVNTAGYISTVAGTLNALNGYAGDGGPATSAQLANPSGVVVDGYGNLYIADNGNNAVRVVYEGGTVLANLIATENAGTTATVGDIYTIAGGPNAAQAANGDGGLATLANLNAPGAVTVDSTGDIFIADYVNQAVRRVDAVTGNISSIASGIDSPSSLSVDSSDSIYFTGHSSCSVFQYNPSLQANLTTPFINTVAGNGTCTASGDGDGATNAGFSGAAGVVVDGKGNLYVLESDGVRLVNGQGGELDFGNTDISAGATAVALVTDDNILPPPGSSTVVDFSNTPFSVFDNGSRYFSITPIRKLNANLPDCDLQPPQYTYLVPGSACAVEVLFQPAVDGGPFTNGAFQYLANAPAYISLTGSGTGTLPTASLTGTPTTFVAVLNESTSPAQTFTLTNTAAFALRITGIGIQALPGTPNGYFAESDTCAAVVQDSEYVLQAGASCQITVSFVGTSVGNVVAALQVMDNASTGGGLQSIPLNATVVAPLGEFVDSTGVNLITSATALPTTPGSSSSFAVNFTNAGTSTLTLSPSSWVIRGANENSFTIVTNTCGTTLGIGATCTLGLNFAPTALTYGTYTASLVVLDDSGGQPLSNGNHTYIQQSLTLIGPTGATPQQTSSFSLQNAAFPSEAIGSPVIQNVTLVMNDASNVLSITTAAGSEYSVGSYAPCSGPAGTACTVPITFTPTGVGSRPGTLIVANLENGVAVPYFLSMTGSGTGTLASLTPGIISTVVGSEGGQILGIVGANGPATQAQVGSVSDFAMDSAGEMFLADQQNEVIWKVDTSGQAYLYAGSPLPVGDLFQQRMVGDGGPALGADLAYVGPIALDSKGGLYLGSYDYIAYEDERRIRYIDPSTHVIDTVAGYVPFFYWQATSQFFGGNPLRVVVNGTAYRYLAPGNGVSGATPPVWPTTMGSTVLDGTITWINEGPYTATNGCAAQTDALGDGCPAQDITIGIPTGLAVDAAGDLYFAESELQGEVVDGNSTTETETPHSMIRRIDATTGIVTLVAGTGTPGYSPDGTLATAANIQARGLAFDSKGTLYFIDAGLYVRKIDPATGVLTTITGNAVTTNGGGCGTAPNEGGSAIGVGYSLLSGIAFDAADNLYIADGNACVVRRIDAATQTIHTVAGGANPNLAPVGYAYGDFGQPNSDGSALEAELSEPGTVRLDSLANLYIGGGYGGVRKVDVSQSVLPFAGPYGQQDYTQIPFTVSAPLTATVLNAGNSGNLEFGSPFLSVSWGINQNYFIRDTTDPTGADCYDQEFIAPGTECPVNVDFAPQASSPSLVYAQDNVADDAPTSPQIIQLSGIGLGPTPAVTLTPSIVSVFTPQAGTSAPQQVTLSNNTSSPIGVNNISIAGTGAGSFSQTSNCAAQLPANSSCVVQVTFSPPIVGAGTTSINQHATLSVSESVDSAPQVAQLIGVGTPPVANPGPLTINETIHVSEGTPQLVSSRLLQINDNVTVSEGTPALTASQLLQINDNVTVSEGTPALTASQLLQINDNVIVSEGTPAFTASQLLQINDNVTVSEGKPALTASGLLSINDNVTVSDSSNLGHALPTTTTTLQYSAASIGDTRALVVTVSPAVATGSVQIYDGTIPFASGQIVNGTYIDMFTSLSPGVHQFQAVYGGSAQYASSTSNHVQVISDAVLDVAVQEIDRAFGVPNPNLMYQTTGFVDGDTSAVLTGTPFLSTSAALNSPAGVYPINIAKGTLAAPAYYSFTFAAATLTVGSNNLQRIIFQPFPPQIALKTGRLTPSAYSTAALPITYQVAGPATLNSDGTLTLTGSGLVTVTATQAGNVTFSAATPIVRSFEVTQ